MHYWSDATLIACYLINCTPSSVSNKQIAHEVLFPKNPCSMSLLRYLVALALCTTLVRKRTSWILFPIKCIYLGTPEFRLQELPSLCQRLCQPQLLISKSVLSFLREARLFNWILQLSMSITTSFQFSRYCCWPALPPPIFTFTAVPEPHAPPSSTSISPYSCLHLLPFWL